MQYPLITTLIWPPYSPDLNQTEYIWWELKQTIHELYPYIEDEGLLVEARGAFEGAAQEA
jgi:transposase